MTGLAAKQPETRRSFDAIVERLSTSATTLTEANLLDATHWKLGQDARLREDLRFRKTSWGRWMRVEDLLANDAIHRDLHAQRRSSTALQPTLEGLDRVFGRRCVFCPDDPRFVLRGDVVRLAAAELSNRPVVEDEVGALEKYTTHLPLHSLKAAAASEPAGEWGSDTQEQMIETLGWIPLSIPGNRLNSRMFVAEIEGHSMDNGESGLVDGGYAVFELWPAGTKQFRTVLVRGSFRDPETGSYAVKKYVADQRNADGRHQQITLVSLNPDKERYPDIELQVEDDEALAVVAKVIQPLGPDEYLRRPKPLRRKGRRDLESDEGRQKIHERLAANADRFFAEPAPVPADATKPDTGSWNSQVVCLDAESGALHLEIGPLHGLWKFVKILVARTAAGQAVQTLASNARLRPVRVPVLPSGGARAWVADGFEDDPDVDLSALDLPGLSHDRATAFRVGADGVGRVLNSNLLSPGQHYRLLVPPEVWSVAESALPAVRLPDAWLLVELALATEVAPELVRELQALGFALGDIAPAFGFGVASWPDEWRSTPRGEPFACFTPGSRILVEVDGYDAEIEGEARLFVQGPLGCVTLALPAGSGAVVELSDVDPGRYFCSLLHQRTRIQPAHLPFEVDELAAVPPTAHWCLEVAGVTCNSRPNHLSRAWRGDLGTIEVDDLVLSGPPGWTVRVLWREIGDDYLTTFALDESGQLDVEALLSVISDRRRRRLLGDLLLDLGELGAALLEHEQWMSPDSVGDTLRALVDRRGEVVQRRRGAYAQLLPTWFVPVGQCLGYEVEAIEENPDDPPPGHAAAARLLVTERRAGGIFRRCRRVLIMLEDLEPDLGEELFAWIDRVCLRHDTNSALISTGLEWAEHRRRSRLPLDVWNLSKVLSQADAFIAFLRDVAEGV